MKTSLQWLPVLLWAAVIFVLSSMPVPPSPVPEFPFRDKVAHVILYAVLATLVARTLRRAHRLTLPATLTLAILMASAYGVTDEVHQRFVPRRSCDVRDWVADTLGATLAAAAFYAYESRRSAKANRQAA